MGYTASRKAARRVSRHPTELWVEGRTCSAQAWAEQVVIVFVSIMGAGLCALAPIIAQLGGWGW